MHNEYSTKRNYVQIINHSRQMPHTKTKAIEWVCMCVCVGSVETTVVIRGTQLFGYTCATQLMHQNK